MTITTRPNLFDSNDYQKFLERIHKIKADSKPLWGKMTAAQMLAHCREVQEACGGKELKKTPFFIKLIKGFIRKSVLNDKPFSKGSPTHQQYIISDDRAFEEEQKRFLDSLELFVQHKGSVQHSLFGEMTQEERSWAVYKHHNHHLEQFGV